MIRRRLLCFAALLITFTSTASDLFAGEIEVVVTDCPKDEFRSLDRLLEVETSASSPETATWIREHRPQLSVRCREKVISLSLETKDQTLAIDERAIDRGEAIARDMPRFVALATMELIASVASVADTSSAQPTEETATEEISAPVQPESPPRRAVGRWSLGALTHGGGQPFNVTFGGVLSGEILLPARLCVAADAQFTLSNEDVSIGNIRQTVWSGAAALLIRFQAKRWAIRPGVGFRGGQVFWKGDPDSAIQTTAYNVNAPWGGPFLALLTSSLMSEKLEISLNLEVGYTAIEAGALVNNERELYISGVWGAVSLGIGTLL